MVAYKKPSVSNILEILHPFDYENVPEYVLTAAINKGNCIHKRAEAYIKEDLKMECICKKKVPSHEKLFERLLDDLNEYKGCEFKSELFLENKEIAGIIDLVVVTETDIIIADYKTNSQQLIEKWKDQLLMYNYLFTGKWEVTNDVKLQIWHYNAKFKKTIHNFLPSEFSYKNVEDIKKAIKYFWDQQDLSNDFLEEKENGWN